MADWVNDNGELDDLLNGPPDGDVQCRYCGMGGLHWMDISTRGGKSVWQLANDTGDQHMCIGW